MFIQNNVCSFNIQYYLPEVSTCCVGDLFAGREIQVSEIGTVSTEALRCLVTDLRALVQYQFINVTTAS